MDQKTQAAIRGAQRLEPPSLDPMALAIGWQDLNVWQDGVWLWCLGLTGERRPSPHCIITGVGGTTDSSIK